MQSGSLENFDFSVFEGKSEIEIYKFLALSDLHLTPGKYDLLLFTLQKAGLDVDRDNYVYFRLHDKLDNVCRRCKRPGKPRPQNTAYNDRKANWAVYCDECQEEADKYWTERWHDYYNGLL